MSIHFDAQLRSTDELQHIQTYLLRTGLNYHLNKSMTVTGGYAFINNRRVVNNVSGYAPEHRIWEQFVFNHKIKRVAVQHRFRLEQRFIAKSIVVNNELKNDGTVNANRLRYFLRSVIPFQKQQPFTKGIFGVVQNELFFNVGDNDNVNDKVFDQNRFYLAMGYRLCKKMDVELGYMNQYVNGRGNASINNNIIQIASYLRL